jgi:hypothetical protein
MPSRKRTSWPKHARFAVALLLMLSSLAEARNFKIKIGPKAKDLTDEQTGQPVKQTSISKNAKDTIHWDTHKKGRVIFLIFHVPPDCGSLFSTLTDLHTVDAKGRKLFQLGNVTTEHLDSGTVADACRCVCTLDPAQCDAIDPANPKPWQIKYDQYLQNDQGQTEHFDGWIIVKG